MQSTTSRPDRKPAKPHPDFPLYAHANGRWAKRIRGKIHYFGPWSDPQGALERWLDQKDDLLAGRVPGPKTDGVTVADLCNHFLNHKRQLVESGELADRTFHRYYATCQTVVLAFGAGRVVPDLRQEDFQTLRASMAKRWGPVAIGNEVQIVRSLFKYGYDAELLDKPLRFGPGFRKPSAKTLRLNRAARGPRLFTPEEVHKALDAAGPNMRAMILLGLNGGLGNTDLGLLPIHALDLDRGWIDYPRSKTAILRRFPLWQASGAGTSTIYVAPSRPSPRVPGTWLPSRASWATPPPPTICPRSTAKESPMSASRRW